MFPLNFLMGTRSFVRLAIGTCFLGCGGAEFGSASNSGGAAGGGGQGGNAGSVASEDASTNDAGSNGSGGSGQSRDGAAGTSGAGGMTGAGGSMCPPCAAPPNPACVGQGPCGCGPYVCPDAGMEAGKDAGKDAAAEAGPRCGETAVCPLGRVCCNPLKGICTLPGMTCIQ